MATARHPKATFFVQRHLFSGLTSFAELEKKIAALPDEQSRGAAFEVFAEAYLATQRKHDAAQVWPHGSVPLDILKNLGLTQQDQGVDGVLQTLLGQFNAYQVKFRTGRPALTWRELSTFIGLADSPHIHSRVLLTNCDELPAVLNDRQGFFCIRGADLDRLEAGDFCAMEAWLADAAFVAPKKSPQPHQTEALAALLPALQTHDRVSAIMACGTGKTLVALWIAEHVAQASSPAGSADLQSAVSRICNPRAVASPAAIGDATDCRLQIGDTAGYKPALRILVLLPSLALLRQTLHEWLRETRLPSLAYLCVCSDPTVKEGIDALTTPQSDLDFQVSTDAASVRSFLDAPFADVKMIFSTYQSASVVGAALRAGAPISKSAGPEPSPQEPPGSAGVSPASQEEQNGTRRRDASAPGICAPCPPPFEGFDLGIFDEAHKTAGREGRNFAFALDDKNLPIRKRLFLTATPRHYNPHDRDREGEARLLFSMDNPAVYGPQACRLTFAEAARRGIICGYKVIISVITSEMVTNELLSHGEVLVNGDAVRARQVANQIALRDAIEKYGVKKVFTFHRDVKSAQSFVSAGPEGIGTHLNGGAGFQPAGSSGVPAASPETAGADARITRTQDACATFQTFHVNGSMPTARRERELRDFRAAARAVVSNARCLTEGVDVPAVDMVAFLSPRRSRVDIVQATGRAMRRSPDENKTTGYVLVPLYLEQVAGESIEAAVNRAEFDEVWDVLQAMQEQDNVLAEIIREMREERGRTKGFDDSRFRDRVEILGTQLTLNDLRKAITTKCVEILADNWEERFGELRSFQARFGHCNVPGKWNDNPRLGMWVSKQRVDKKSCRLKEERVRHLDSIGFVWHVLDKNWEGTFCELQIFKAKFGHCNVPARFSENPRLSLWVNNQRQRNRIGKLSAARVKRLDGLGFVWSPFDAVWEEFFARLSAHKQKQGHCNVRRSRTDDRELASWLHHQRKNWKDGHLDEEQLRRLNKLGVVWNPFDAAWEEMFSALLNYKQIHGHCNVPRGWKENSRLASWVNTQRRLKDKRQLDKDRIRRLENESFVWDRSESFWEEKFELLKQYKSERGNCNVPARWSENPELASWVHEQRKRWRRGKLSQERMRGLEHIGFLWSAPRGPRGSASEQQENSNLVIDKK